RYYVIGSTVGAYPFDATHASAPEDRGYVAAYDAHHAIEWLITTDLVASRQLERHGDRLYAVMRGQEANAFPIELEGVRFTTDDGIGFDWFTIALTTAGAVRWGHGSDTDDRANGLAVLADHVVRAGYHTIATGGGLSSHRYQLDALDHDGTTLDGYDDFGVPGGSAVAEGGGVVYVAANGPDGWVLQRYIDRTLDWERALGEAVHVSDVVVDARGRAYLGGTLSGAHSFDGEHLGEEHDGWVAAFDAEGGLRWVDIVDNPAGSLWVVMKEVEVSLASGLVYYRYRVTSRDGERVVALRQPE
ncbi:MAG TPA: hypothetical protein RMI62_20295, partial [Polyangiaceae bacterium LLY-WYZ-15_(1-7)]|nr:hypothetical protein [Polyangiaceae bacterium LLY-WYZ-15_(1-7)]